MPIGSFHSATAIGGTPLNLVSLGIRISVLKDPRRDSC